MECGKRLNAIFNFCRLNRSHVQFKVLPRHTEITEMLKNKIFLTLKKLFWF